MTTEKNITEKNRKQFFTGALFGIASIALLITVVAIWINFNFETYGNKSRLINYYIELIYIPAVILAVGSVIWIISSFYQKTFYSKILFDFSGITERPTLILDDNFNIKWNNLGQIDYLADIETKRIVSIVSGYQKENLNIQQCLNNGEAAVFENQIKINGQETAFIIKFFSINKGKSKLSMVCMLFNIEKEKTAEKKIDALQRELQMQNEMLSLITAQMEVQQAGIKEQNEKLTEQHKKMEAQAQMLILANKELETQNKQITVKSGYITDSIKYAQTIQEAMLPSVEQMSGFYESFIIYRPKDIVSGDFYWLSIKEKYCFAILGDCTGHGVPGAFMSLIGIRILGELINENNIDRPSVILEAMHERIVQSLKQNYTENDDGMDIAICRIERTEKSNHNFNIQYAGAKQPIFIKRKNRDKAEIINCDRRGIGGHSYNNFFFFEDNDFSLDFGDRIYLTSDGIKDQNNISRKRFGTKQLIELLGKSALTNMADQKYIIEETLNNWQGLEEQRDDISLWGFELSDITPEADTVL